MTDKTNFSDGQEIIYQDLNKVSSRGEKFLLDKVIYELLGRNTSGFFQDSLEVSRISNNQVSVKPGLGFMTDVTQTYEPDAKPIYSDQAEILTHPTANPSEDRIDIVVVKHDLADGDTESRKVKDAFSSNITNENLVVSKEWSKSLLVVEGTPAPSPSAPATPAGYILLAEVLVEASTGIVAAGNVTDKRSLLPLAGSVGATGNREYDAVIGDTSLLGNSHETLKAALDDAAVPAGSKILVTRDESIDATPSVDKDDIEIVFKSGVTFTKGTATKGLIINANGAKVHGGRFADFSTGGDIGVEIVAAKVYNMLRDMRFSNCDTAISGLTGNNNQSGTIEE